MFNAIERTSFSLGYSTDNVLFVMSVWSNAYQKLGSFPFYGKFLNIKRFEWQNNKPKGKGMPGPPCGKKSQWLRAVWRYVRITRLSERGNDRPSRFRLPDQIISSPQHWHTQSVLIIPVLSSTLHYSAPPETHQQTKQTLRAQTKSWEWTSQKDWLHNKPWATPGKKKFL